MYCVTGKSSKHTPVQEHVTFLHSIKYAYNHILPATHISARV
jgi:hypothetical protein